MLETLIVILKYNKSLKRKQFMKVEVGSKEIKTKTVEG
jgi:hypothetical protein